MAAKVSVSVVSFNNRAFIGDCLGSVARQDYGAVETVLVDNASTDGTVEYVRDNYPDVRVIVNEQNELFCAGQNRGIKAGDGEYVLALNSDVVLDEHFIGRAVAAMESDPAVGSVTGRVLRSGGGVIDTTGLFLGRDRRPVERGYGEPDDGRYMEPGYVFGVGGVCPLYRREMLEDVAVDGEYFDESYGAFYEDLDLAWRAVRRGWKALYVPDAVAYHQRGATARTGPTGPKFMEGYAIALLPDFLKARLVVNRYMTIIKNDTASRFFKRLPQIALYDLKLWAYLIFFAPGALPDALSGMKRLPRAWRRRKQTDGH